MTNVNGDLIPLIDTSLPPDIAQWPLDMYLDDDEFRAGYPFPPAPENLLDGKHPLLKELY